MKFKRLIYIPVVYYILFSIVLIYYHLEPLFGGDPISNSELLIDLIISILYLIVIGFNLEIVLYDKHPRFLVKFLIAFTLFQVVHLRLFGLMIDVSSGMEIMPYLYLNGNTEITISLSAIKFITTVMYDNHAQGFYLGFNLIPMFLAYLYYGYLKSISDQKTDKINVSY